MSSTERLGFVIVATVFTLMVAGVLCAGIACIVALAKAPNVGWLDVGVVLALGATLPSLVTVGRAFWSGQEAVRRISLIVLVVAGAGIIGSAVWMTTLDFPHAATPADRLEMQADARHQLPWWVAGGMLPITMAGLLLLPPVGHFLSYRRGAQAHNGHPE
jgi:hypothetical protein